MAIKKRWHRAIFSFHVVFLLVIGYGEDMNTWWSSYRLGIVFLLLIIAVVGMWWWFQAPKNDQYNNPSARYYKDLERSYAEDTYGGSTPEETLKLFIAALEAGNIDLASKYFVVEKQEEWKKELGVIKGNGNIAKMVNDISRATDGKELFDGHFQFTILDPIKTDHAEFTISLLRIPNGKWKIQSL